MSSKSNLGTSLVLEAVILTSVLCIIVFAASSLANEAINGKMENAQFDQAKNVILALDEMIKRIVYRPESLGRVETSFWTTHPHFIETEENMNVAVWASGQKELEVTVPVNIVKVKGGERASVAADRDLVGDGSLLLINITASLGRVQEYQSGGAWVALDYSRVRCTYTGIMQYYNGTDYEPCNLVEIIAINMIFGDLEAQEQASFIVKNQGSSPIQKEISKGTNPTIIVQKSGVQETRTLAELGGDPNYKSLVNLVVVNIEISISGAD